MTRLALFTILALLTGLSGAQEAGKVPPPGPVDPRVRTVAYDPNAVITLDAHYFHATHVKFADYEKVTDVALGDQVAWSVAVTAAENGLIVKPIEPEARGNLFVATNHRTYQFELRSHNGRDPDQQVYQLRFAYADDVARQMAVEDRRRAVMAGADRPSDDDELVFRTNTDYEWAGDETIKPSEVFDDGRFTYFLFDDVDRLPAIFAVDEHGTEQLVNFHIRGDYAVVQRRAKWFTLRDGDSQLCIVDRSRVEPDYETRALVAQ